MGHSYRDRHTPPATTTSTNVGNVKVEQKTTDDKPAAKTKATDKP